MTEIEDIKFNNVLKYLKSAGFNFDFFEKINDGINSNCWKLSNQRQIFFLKFYKNSNQDNRDRFTTEIKFLKFLNQEKFTNVPSIISLDPHSHWALFSWIDGEKIKVANSAQWKQYLDFIIRLQNFKYSESVNLINNASEACFSIKSHYLLIENRLNSFLHYISNQKLFFNLKDWLNYEIVNRLDLIKIEIKQNKNNNNSTIDEKIISPSDVGFHNIINNFNQLYFIDFEYAGWDDVYKLFIDLIIRPDNLIEEKQAMDIINYLSKGMKISFDKKTFKTYIDLYRIKWILIILNKVSNNKISSEYEAHEIYNKVLKYYKDVGNIWRLKN